MREVKLTRGRSEHLDNAERTALHADICAGFKTSFLTGKYNLSERAVQTHKSALAAQGRLGQPIKECAPQPDDKRASESRGPSFGRLCFVSGCERPVSGAKFCSEHEYRAPPNVAQLTRGRA